jgi:hypothetical protein
MKVLVPFLMACLVAAARQVAAQNVFVPERLTPCNAPVEFNAPECLFALNGMPIATGFDPASLEPGSYILEYDCQGELGADYFEVGNTLWVDILPLQITGCPGQLAVLEAEHFDLRADATYYWQPGNVFGPVLFIYPTQSQIYTLTVTTTGPDGVECSGVATYFVNASGLNIDVSATPNPSCPNELVFLSAEAASDGVTYLWRSPMGVIGSEPTLFVNPFTTTTYTVTATDTNGCTGQRTLTVNVTQVPNLTASVQNATCSGCSNGSITVQPPGLQYYVNGLLYFNNTIGGLTPGSYAISAVVPPNFCSTQTIYVTVGVTASCSTPTGLQLVSATSNSALLSWNSVSGASSYRVRYRRTNATLWTTVVTAATSINLPGLMAETNYVATVAAVCASGTSAFSPLLSFSTTAASAPACTPASGFNAAAGPSSGTIFVSWNEVAVATRYQIQYRRVGYPFWTSMTVNAPANGALLTGLTGGQSYEVRMRVVCGSTAMAWQPAITLVAPGGRSAAPDAQTVFSIYPNPARDWVVVRLQAPGAIAVYDLSGKNVLTRNGTTGENLLDVSVLAPGVYLLHAGQFHARQTVKLVVE